MKLVGEQIAQCAKAFAALLLLLLIHVGANFLLVAGHLTRFERDAL